MSSPDKLPVSRVRVLAGGGVRPSFWRLQRHVSLRRPPRGRVGMPIGHIGPQAAHVVADVTDRRNHDAVCGEICAPFGSLGILIYAAGIKTRQVANEVTQDRWDQTLALNLSAPFFLSQALVPAMKSKGWGRIVNFASLQYTRAFARGIAYGVSKAGFAQLTRAVAQACSPHGISANAIDLGFFPTELTQAIFDDNARAERNAAQSFLGCKGGLEDIDGPVLFLCSEASSFVTGQVLMVDGGAQRNESSGLRLC